MVLYNLINVNISERIREIATIKVLGFYDNEVEMYVYRENIVLSIIGSLVGLVLGVFLHRYIMNVIEMDDVIFPHKIFWYSYFYICCHYDHIWTYGKSGNEKEIKEDSDGRIFEVCGVMSIKFYV